MSKLQDILPRTETNKTVYSGTIVKAASRLNRPLSLDMKMVRTITG